MLNERGSGASASLRIAGSLWLGAVLSVLLLVAMACATVYETTRGTEMALGEFYRTRWFKVLLGMLALNILAALVIRYPFNKRRVGFVVTHASILVILGGAWVTSRFAIDGQAGIAEGQTVREFGLLDRDTLAITNRLDSTTKEVDLTSPVFTGFRPVDNPAAPVLSIGELRVEIVRYLPDSITHTEVVDDHPGANPAVEVTLSPPGHDHGTWLFVNKPATLGSLKAVFRVVNDADELERLLTVDLPDEAQSDGVVRVAYGELKFDLALSKCLEEPVALGELGYSIRVLRYLPHATVGPDNKLVNTSNQPLNPAIEAELIGPDGSTERRLAFARFPDFGSMHGGKKMEGFRVTLVTPAAQTPTAPVEVLAGPADEMYVRFSKDGTQVAVRELTAGTPVDTPWSGQQFTLLRRFEHARRELAVLSKEPGKKGRVPAVLLKLQTPAHTSEMWLQKYRPYPVTVDGTPFELSYAHKTVPLGFAVTLNSFKIRYYPGGNRPRSFESQITIDDPSSGGAMTRVVSMNSPVKYRGYSFYQSSYRQEPGRVVSYLSIARDPGLPIVFTGYIGALMGMTIVLGTRMAERRRAVQAEPVAIGLGQADNPRASGSAATRQPETESRALAGAGHKSRTLTRFSRSSR